MDRTLLLYFPPPPLKPAKEGTVRVQKLERVIDPVARIYAKYFGRRNNRNIEITPYNYNEEALKYSLTAFQATNLATNIVRRVPFEKFTVVELRPLVGTTSLALLDRPEIDFLIVSEFQYARQFETNISAYGFDRKVLRQDRIASFEGNREFEGQVAVVHLDPGSNDLSQGMRLINLLPELAKVFTMIFVQTDQLPTMKGFKHEVNYIDIGALDETSEKGKKGEASKKNEVSKKKRESVKFAVIFSELGLEKAKAKKMKIRDVRQDRREWTPKQVEELRAFLLKTLPKFGIKKHLEKFVDDKAMIIWMRIFTHKSIDPRPEHNYEADETYGDGILEGLFTIYLHDQIPDIDPEKSTLLFQQYMSKFLQPDYTEMLGLDKYLRIEVMYRGAKEDLFEAFTAGLYLVAKGIYGRIGPGVEIVMDMISYIFADKVKYNWKEIVKGELKQPRTIVKERLDQLYLRDNIKVQTTGNKIIASVYIIQKEGLDLFRQIGIIIDPDLMIGQATIIGNNRTQAEREAYENAIKYLDTQGFTKDRAITERERLQEVDPSLKDLGAEITETKTNVGLEAVYFITNPASCRTILYGVLKGNYRRTILAEVTDCNEEAGKRRAIEAWLG